MIGNIVSDCIEFLLTGILLDIYLILLPSLLIAPFIPYISTLRRSLSNQYIRRLFERYPYLNKFQKSIIQFLNQLQRCGYFIFCDLFYGWNIYPNYISPAKQARLVRNLQRNQHVEGDIYYPIATKWYRKFNKYTKPGNELTASKPGKINNYALQGMLQAI